MTDTPTDPDAQDREGEPYRVAFVCQRCGYLHENSPSNYLNIHDGDYCPKCGRQFEPSDHETRKRGESFPSERGETE